MISTPPTRIPVHEQKLAACSPLLRRLLSRAPRPNIRGGRILKFENVEVRTFEAFVEWLYGNSGTRMVRSNTSSVTNTTTTACGGDNDDDGGGEEGVVSEALRAFAREYEVAFLVEEEEQESGCAGLESRRAWRDRGGACWIEGLI